MDQLTIDNARAGIVVTSHTDRPAAWNALQRYAVDADVYLHTIQATQPHSSYDLVELTDRPLTAGCAVIELMPTAAEALYYRALEARRWIDQQRTEPTGCAARVLARARAAAANPAAARSLLQEAAALADVHPALDVDPIISNSTVNRCVCRLSSASSSPAIWAVRSTSADSTTSLAALLGRRRRSHFGKVGVHFFARGVAGILAMCSAPNHTCRFIGSVPPRLVGAARGATTAV